MFFRNVVEMELEARGLIDTAAGEHVIDVQATNGELAAVVSKE
jgi:hypothetical protein